MRPGRDQPNSGDDRQSALFDERLASQDQTHPGYAAAFRRLEEKLLQHGGRRAVPPLQPDILTDMLTGEGRVFGSEACRFVRGVRNDCHLNAVRLWRDQHADAIGTGYALSEDGLWREHSWGLTEEGVVETTSARVRYFGVEFADERAEWFADWIDPPPTDPSRPITT